MHATSDTSALPRCGAATSQTSAHTWGHPPSTETLSYLLTQTLQQGNPYRSQLEGVPHNTGSLHLVDTGVAAELAHASAPASYLPLHVPQGTAPCFQSTPTRNVRVPSSPERVVRTVYVSDMSGAMTEVLLAEALADCGRVVDCRVCGDASSAARFAFVEFSGEDGAEIALKRNGSISAGGGILRIARSKTAILPVHDHYLPRSEREMERVTRTVYVGNIDRHVGRDALRTFFEAACGTVIAVRVLSDLSHATAIAFLEFERADAAHAALACSGTLIGALRIRVSPSKTPVRTASRGPRRTRACGRKAIAQSPESREEADALVVSNAGSFGGGDASALDSIDERVGHH